jgi:hypothetical protein
MRNAPSAYTISHVSIRQEIGRNKLSNTVLRCCIRELLGSWLVAINEKEIEIRV